MLQISCSRSLCDSAFALPLLWRGVVVASLRALESWCLLCLPVSLLPRVLLPVTSGASVFWQA